MAGLSSINRFGVGPGRRLAVVFAAGWALAAFFTASGAHAACIPLSPVNSTSVTCNGTTTNQDNPSGYGTVTDTGNTITVVPGASVTGTSDGLTFSSGIVYNSGTITGQNSSGIYANTTATVTNSGTISGVLGIWAANTTATVTNSGSISGNNFGIYANTTATVTNSGTISSGIGGITSNGATVINSGAISGGVYGISANTTATVFNSGAISGQNAFGIFAGNTVNVTNSGTIISLSDGIRTNGTATVDNAGTISGSIGIRADAGSSMVLNSGTIIGTGGTAISFLGAGNTLTIAPTSVITGNVTGGNNFQLGGIGTGSFDVSAIGAGQQYQGFNVFNKVDLSTWTVTGTSTFTGATTVDAGTLFVNGNLTSSSGVTVNNGGTLGGTGTVGGVTVASGGTFAPGNSTPGSSMTVNGNLAFQSGALYLVQLNPTTASLANVTGTSTLAGSTLSVFANGTYVSRRYTILSSAGGVSGTFNSLVNTNLPSGFNATLSYDPTHAYLDLALNFTGPSFGAGLNGNQQNVANTLTNFFNATGSIPAAFGALTPAGLTQASGELATGTQQTTDHAMNLFMGLLTDPFIGNRGYCGAPEMGSLCRASDGGASAYASGDKPRGSRAERDAYAAVYGKAPPPVAPYAPRWSVWAAGYGGSETTNGNAITGSNSATSRIYGVAVGADYLLSPRTIAGFSLAGGGTNFSVVNGGTGRSDLLQAGAFFRHTVDAAYLTGALAYGWQDVTTSRTMTVAGIDQLQARFHANAFSGRLEGGYRFATPWMGITPYAAGQFTSYDLPAYAEQVLSGANTFALNYGAKNVTASRSELGLRTDNSYALTIAILTLRSRFAWAHNFNPDASITPTFQALPGASFVVNGAAQARDAALTSLSAELKWRNGFSLAGVFEGEFSSTTTSYAGKGVARYSW